ncbi:MAG: cobalamin biosynthesis protein CobD [Rhizobiaceae bacterium]|nr:cobalamin biosynthesis protein CobD [Rhizobiaceae bacterium]
MFLFLALSALLAEIVLGYPAWLFRAIGHPVSWIGRLIGYLDRMLNRAAWSDGRRRLAGVFTLLVLVALPAALAWGVAVYFAPLPYLGLALVAVLASSLLAQRSLASHVSAVAKALEDKGLEAGRAAVSRIVGRDPERLDEPAVCRAAIESLAENFSDGVVAPAFWLAAGGLPAGVAYKAINTADSMIGHKNDRYRAFGWAAARLDDLVNLPASRLSGVLVVAAAAIVPGAGPGAAWQAIRRDAHRHRSPNAGWPEAAMAGALGISIAGARHYGGVLVQDAEMGMGGRRELTTADIRLALTIYWVADLLLIGLIGIGALAFSLPG